MKCTWLDCASEGTQAQRARDDSTWAVLCESHVALLEAALASGSAPRVLSAWVKAQGGAAAAAKRAARGR